MKTHLPDSIKTIDEAKAFLTELYNNDEHFHPEDDAHGIIWNSCEEPTKEECDKLNDLMCDIYNLPGNDGKHDNSIAFCPCGFLLELDPEYVKMRDADTDDYNKNYSK